MKIGIKRHLKRVALSLLNMGYYSAEYDDILPGDIYVLDTADARDPFSDTKDKKVEIISTQKSKCKREDYLRFRHFDDMGLENMTRKDFLKKYFREK